MNIYWSKSIVDKFLVWWSNRREAHRHEAPLTLCLHNSNLGIHMFFCLVWSGRVLWHINTYGLFKATFCLYISLPKVVESDRNVPFTIATIPRWTAPLTLFPLECWELSNAVSSTMIWIFGMTRPGIEPWSPGPLANTLTIMPTHIWFLSE